MRELTKRAEKHPSTKPKKEDSFCFFEEKPQINRLMPKYENKNTDK